MIIYSNATNAIRKTIRTVCQLLVSAGATTLISLVVGHLTAAEAAAVLAVFQTAVTWAHNLLEDKGIIGTWLRTPTLEKPIPVLPTDVPMGPVTRVPVGTLDKIPNTPVRNVYRPSSDKPKAGRK